MTMEALDQREQAVLSSVSTGVFIGGSWREAEGGGRFGVDDPATGEQLVEIADGTENDARAALDAACAVQDAWAATPPRDRGEILRRAFELLHARAEDYALLMTLEMGKPLAEARAELVYGAEFFRWFSEEAVRIGGEYRMAPDGGSRFVTMRQPVGPCLLVTPWNFPLAMLTRKIGPAVAAGCTIVVKPAGLTPLTTLMLTDLLVEAGLPAGVLNVVTTRSSSKVVGTLLADPRLRKMSFTGSTPVGRTLMKEASGTLARLSMELGGNAPFIVLADADVDAAVEGAMVAKLRNGGQSCVAANRMYVDAAVAEEFTAKLGARVGALRVGRGTDDGVDVGPLVDGKARDGVAKLLDDALSQGARVAAQSQAPTDRGAFCPPTVLTGLPADARILGEEIFGPVAPIVTVRGEEEAVAAANSTEYGLAAYVFSRDIGRALRTAERVQAGMIGLNRGLVSNPAAPFGGIKQSGYGREGGFEGIDEYLDLKYVAVQV